MVVNFNCKSINQGSADAPLSDVFLNKYTFLRDNLIAAFEGRRHEACSYSTVSYHVTRMKDFALNSGGVNAVELLAEYEKSSSIGDSIRCRALENRILNELHIFKECWLSTIC